MSDKNFEEKLKKHWREEADSIPGPDSLHPAKIEEMIDKKMEVPKKRTHKKLYAGITAAAACLALLIAGTAYYFNTGRQSEKGTPVANSKQTISDRHEFVGNTSYCRRRFSIHRSKILDRSRRHNSHPRLFRNGSSGKRCHGRRHRQNRRFLYLYHVK